MNDTLTLDRPVAKARAARTAIPEAIIEVISDSGEGAQRCGQSLGAIAARMGNGIWTTEIIPAEIQPPARSVAGASGIRIRIGSERVTNGGDQTELVVAFNERTIRAVTHLDVTREEVAEAAERLVAAAELAVPA